MKNTTSSAREKLTPLEKTLHASWLTLGAGMIALPIYIANTDFNQRTNAILDQKKETQYQPGDLWSQDPKVIQSAIKNGEVNSDGSISLQKGFRIIDEDLEAIMTDPDKTPKIVGKYRVL